MYLYAVAIVSSVNSGISQNLIVECIVITCLALLALCTTTINIFPPLRIFGIKVQHLYSFIHVCLILTHEVLFHFLWQASIPTELLSPIPWSLNVVSLESDLCYVPLSVVALGLLVVMLLNCSVHILLPVLSRQTLHDASFCSHEILNVWLYGYKRVFVTLLVGEKLFRVILHSWYIGEKLCRVM